MTPADPRRTLTRLRPLEGLMQTIIRKAEKQNRPANRTELEMYDACLAAFEIERQLQRATDALDAAGWRHCHDCGMWWKVGSPVIDRTWRAMETAPEATYVLVWLPNYGAFRATRTGRDWWCSTMHGGEIVYPSHWQPDITGPSSPDDQSAGPEVHARTCPRAQTDQQAVKVKLEANPDVIQESMQSGMGFVKPTKTWMCRACNGVSVISADDIQHYANCARPR